MVNYPICHFCNKIIQTKKEFLIFVIPSTEPFFKTAHKDCKYKYSITHPQLGGRFSGLDLDLNSTVATLYMFLFSAFAILPPLFLKYYLKSQPYLINYIVGFLLLTLAAYLILPRLYFFFKYEIHLS